MVAIGLCPSMSEQANRRTPGVHRCVRGVRGLCEVIGVLCGVIGVLCGVAEDSREPGRGAGSGSRLVGCRVWARGLGFRNGSGLSELFSFYFN